MTATIHDIAKASGVSQATVSRVLNSSGYVKDETRDKVLKVIKELNYAPSAIARSLSTSKSAVTSVTWLRFFPRNRANPSSPHPYGPPLHRQGILQAPPLPGPRASLRAMRPQPQTALE